MNLAAIDARLGQLNSDWLKSDKYKRLSGVKKSLGTFFQSLPHSPSIKTCEPQDVLRFLVWKDTFGKTKVHVVSCPFLGDKTKMSCDCPCRLAAASVSNMVHNLEDIFRQAGRGSFWDVAKCGGNPACAPEIKTYCKQIALEQAKSHVLPKQAKPLFLSKVKRISDYIASQLSRPDLNLKQRFVLQRDQAFFKLQFFAADRASDLASVPVQEVKRLPDNSGLVFCHTVTKTIRGGKGAANRFVIKRCDDNTICPVFALDSYVQWCKDRGVLLSPGYLFRKVADSGRVLDEPVSYDGMYSRLKEYLVTLGLYDGETPHGFRAGSSVFMGMSGAVSTPQQMMDHVGWASEETALYYTRLQKFKDAAVVADRLARAVPTAVGLEDIFRKHTDDSLLAAF